MNRNEVTLPDYLCPPCETLWYWQDNGDSITWCHDAEFRTDAKTIAFRTQLYSILTALNEHVGGLPPLSSILLVIDACGSDWHFDNCIPRVGRLSFSSEPPTSTFVYDESNPVARVACWLARLAELPKELRGDVQSQIAILKFALQEVHPYRLESTGTQATDVLQCLSVAADQRDPRWTEAAGPSHSRVRTAKAFETLVHMSWRPIDADALRLWRRTQVASIPPPADVQPLPETRDPVGKALRDLSSDASWGAVARAAIDAASVLSLPRRPSEPDVLPMGGVSDVTNRGDPERLLMTELAQDPLVMLARIASGQALYLRRETPPGPAPQFRPVLIECGIRTWGNVRLQIASVAMAIAAAEERRGETTAQVISMAGDRQLKEDFKTQAGIVTHLERLEPDEYPGDAISRWIDELEEQDELIADPILIVSSATDSDPRFRLVLGKMPRNPLIVRIERDSSATLLRRTALGDEVLQSLSLSPIDPPKTIAPVNDAPKLRTADSSLALFLDVQPCPLRFPDHLDGSWVAATTTPDLFTVTRDRRLLWFDEPGRGGIQLLDRVPFSTVIAHEFDAKKLSLVVGVQGETHYLIEVDLATIHARFVPLQIGSTSSLDYVFDQGALYRFGRTIEWFDRSSGKCLATNKPGYRKHIGGPVIFGSNRLCLVSREAGDIVLHPLNHPFKDGHRPSIAVRDSRGMINLIDQSCSEIAVLDGSDLHDKLNDESLRQEGSTIATSVQVPKLEYRSADGNILVVSDASTFNRPAARAYRDRWKKIDLENRSVTGHAPSDMPRLLALYDPAASRLIQPRNLLKRISGVEFGSDQMNVIMKRGRRWRLWHDQSRGVLMLRSGQPASGARHFFGRSFHLETKHGTARWSLRHAQIGNNHVIADSRGLLHLRKGDDGSEVTLVMYEPHVSGWRSWGRPFGDPYFTSHADSPMYESVLRWLKEFAQQCYRSN